MEKKETGIAGRVGVVIACILINLVGKYIAVECSLPIWLDMAGTCIACYFAGTVGGVTAGVLGNLLFGIISRNSLIYAITSMVVAAALSFCMKKGYFEELSKAVFSSFWIGILSVMISTPMNLLLYKGYSGNMWGDALFDMLAWNNMPTVFCAIADEAIVEMVDKQVCVLIAFIVIHIVLNMRKNRKESGKKTALMLLAATLLPACILSGSGLENIQAYASPVQDRGGAHSERMVYHEGEITEDEVLSDNFTPRIYNNSAGMMSSEANVIEETDDGYIWIGSYAGLTRYDGRQFEFVREGGIASVTCMMTDSSGRLWIGTNDSGVVRYEDGAFTFFTVNDGLPASSIRSFAEREDGVVYVGTTGRVCKVDSSDKITVVEQDITYVISMETYNHILVCIDNNGKVSALDSRDKKVEVDAQMESLFGNCVELTSYGLLLGTSGSDVYVLNADDSGVTVSKKMTASITDIINMEEDQKGRVWVCAETSIGYFEKDGAFTKHHYADFDSSLEWIHADYQGNIWVASSRYGVLKLSESRFSDLFAKAGIPDRVVNAVVSYQGDYYCGTDSGLVILDSEQTKSKENDLTKMLEGVRIRCLMVDHSDRLWICSYSDKGLLCYDKERGVTQYSVSSKQLTSDRVRCVVELEDGTIVVGTADGINFIQDGEVTGKITAAHGLENSQILCLEKGEGGVVYAGTDGGGLYEISNQKITKSYTTKDGLSSNVILRIAAYDGGYVIVTSNALCYMKEKIQILKNFPYFNNYDVIIKGEQAYILSSAGIYVVDAKELCTGAGLHYALYDTAAGLTTGLTANAWNYSDSGAVLYFCCNSGVMGFYGGQDKAASDYLYGITSVLCDGKEIACDNDTYHLPDDARRIILSASVRNYALSNVRVRFYIEGIDSNPEILSYQDLEPLQISNLRGGSYKIHFQLMDPVDDQVLQEQIYILDKKKQVWEQTWYKVYLVIVCIEIIAFATWTVLIIIQNAKRKDELEQLRGELEDKVKEQTKEIMFQQMQTVTALSEAVDAKDYYTSGHSKRVAEYARMIAARMGKDEEEQEKIYRAGLLHDVGKIRIPESIINKNSKLTDEEAELVKIHPVTGYHILKGISGADMIIDGAKFHHEHYDGKGYPNGLQGKDIPEVARIIGVADSYDAMASNRSYRKALAQNVVRSEIEKGKGTQFDPEIADVMLQMIDEDTAYTMKQEEETQRTILVVDDEPVNIRMAQSILDDPKKYKIIGASSGKEALELLGKEEIDFILLDANMPGMSGFETLEHIRKSSFIPVVFMTEDKDNGMIQRAMKLGADDYLMKPFLPMVLREVVHSVLNV